jgi:hypothetical protein
MAGPLGFPAVHGDVPVAEAPAMARAARRRGKRKGTNPLIPIVLFAAMMGLVGYWMFKPGKGIEGELSAEKLASPQVPPTSIDKQSLPLSSDEDGPAWDELVAHPPAAVRVADQFEMRMEPTDDGINIIVVPALNMGVVRVMPNAALQQFIQQHEGKIASQRQTEFEAASQSFMADWQAAKQSDSPFRIENYFDTVGFNRMSGITGYMVVAQIGEHTYRCIHEDAEGWLYFILPASTEEFTLEGRMLPDDKMPLFESRVLVKVTASADEPAPEKTPEPETSPESPTEPMMREPDRDLPPETSPNKTP